MLVKGTGYAGYRVVGVMPQGNLHQVAGRLVLDYKTVSAGLQGLAEGLNHFGVLGVSEVHLAGIHTESTAIVGTVNVLGRKVEMEMRELIGISAVVNLLGIEYTLHGTGDLCYVSHKSIALVIGQLVEIVDMPIVSHQATSVVGLLLEQESTRNTEIGNGEHKVVERLIVGAIQTL